VLHFLLVFDEVSDVGCFIGINPIYYMPHICCDIQVNGQRKYKEACFVGSGDSLGGRMKGKSNMQCCSQLMCNWPGGKLLSNCLARGQKFNYP